MLALAMMPTMSGALGTLNRDEVARATSGLNVLLRAGGSVGTTLAVVVLTSQLSNVLQPAGNVPFDLAAARCLPAAMRAAMLPALGGASGNTLFGLFGIVLLTFISAMFLPRKPKAGVAQMTPAIEEGQLA
jgi:hypothetical protein